MFIQLRIYWQWTLTGLRSMQVRDERGSTVETVILTAVFAALAIAVGAIIVIKVTAKAHSINLN